MEPEGAEGRGADETLDRVELAPAWGDGYAPPRPEGWTLDACPHVFNLDRLEPRPSKTRRGAQFFYIECPWCRTSATLDQVLTGIVAPLQNALSLAAVKCEELGRRCDALDQLLGEEHGRVVALETRVAELVSLLGERSEDS